ncbi:putative PAP/25A-associated, polymerase, nucleotidyl transferase domain-containing protein [Helianthus anomalus]
MGDLGMEEDRPFLPSFAAPLCNPDPNSIRAETWVLAEDPAREVLNCIYPTLDSEEKRKDVIEYVQKLIRFHLGLEVFPYGSVPLKTYLPDGDIDLTVLSSPNVDDHLPREVLRVLQEEEQFGNSEFELKDTQFIDAEVKLVKCLVQDIVIDISFNQLGGLCTLCFLEQVDRLAGKDHLFKRSIILIKAWCYYESRILGAHHGLISTYALETLVLYIFHVFHASLNGPLEVLYRFLDYYAKFDWDNYCISLDGPVCKSSLHGLTMETLENQGTDVLLGAEFRKNCMDMFIVPSKGTETDLRAFNLKNLNIIDPLKENNNLGRSVHKGNYFRIRSAFRYGARRLGKILQQPNSNIKDDIKMFFRSTLQRHKPKCGPDSNLIFATNGLTTLSISSRTEPYYEDDLYSRFSNGDFDDYMADHNASPLTESNSEKEPDPVVEKTGIELLMENGASELVDGDTICLSINKGNNSNSSDSVAETEILNPFSDLTGDYDAHIRNLLYSQGCHGYAMSTTVVRASPSPPSSPYGNKNSWDTCHTSAAAHSWPGPFKKNLASHMNANGVVMGHPKQINGSTRNALRGTGLYIPTASSNTNEDRDRPPTRGRGRGRGPPVSNGHHYRSRVGSGEPKLVLESNHATQSPLEWSPRQARVNANVSNQTHHHHHPSPVNSTANGFPNQARKLEFGSFRSMTENENPPNTEAAPPYVQSPKGNSHGRKQGRSKENPFHLKNEDEFPPLSA